MEGSWIAFSLIIFGLGFFIGRVDWHGFKEAGWKLAIKHLWRRRSYSSVYLRGLNQLLTDQQDAAIDTFLTTLQVSNETLETHFALGSVLRRRGQLERAVRVHQNILQATNLNASAHHQATLELALDYNASGLLDRAEELLVDLQQNAVGQVRVQSLKYLVELFEKEADWTKALVTAEHLCSLMPVTQSKHWRHLQAHYCCELAESTSDVARRQQHLKKGRDLCGEHARIALLDAQRLLRESQSGPALQRLQTMLNSKRYLQISVPLMLDAFAQQQTGELALQELLSLFRQHGEIALIPIIARKISDTEGAEPMLNFVKGALQSDECPSYYADFLSFVRAEEAECAELLTILDRDLGFSFVCDHCGFHGVQWYWCCPACRSWL